MPLVRSPSTLSLLPTPDQSLSQPHSLHQLDNEHGGTYNSKDAQAIENRAVTPLVFALTLLTSICGFLFGYDTGYISGALVVIREDLGHALSAQDKELITSATSLGALVFALLGGPLTDAVGRKWVVAGANVMFIVGAGIQVGAHSLSVMVAGRFVMGWGVGLASLVAPLYISEMAPARYRGRLVVINVLAITAGQLVAYGLAAVLYTAHNGWRWLVAISIVPAAVQMVWFAFMPETPRYLVRSNRLPEARKVLESTYQDSSAAEIDAKLAELVTYNSPEYATGGRGRSSPGRGGVSAALRRWAADYVELHRVPAHLRALIITCGLQAIQQLSGFNALMYFSATIFESVGFQNPTAVSLIVAGTNFVFTLVAFTCIDRVGRRRILLYTIWGMVAGLLLAAVGFAHLDIDLGGSSHTSASAAGLSGGGWSLLAILAMLFYIAFYACGIGNVPWQQSELFPMSVRGVGTSLATATNWAGSLLISSTFLSMLQKVTPAGTFAFYGGLCVLGEVFVYYCYPETANCTLEEVQELLTGGFKINESVRRNRARRAAASGSAGGVGQYQRVARDDQEAGDIAVE